MSDTARNPEEGKGHTCHNGVTHHDVCPCRQELAEENLRLTERVKRYGDALEGVLNAYKRDDLSFLGGACLAEKIAKQALAESDSEKDSKPGEGDKA